MSDPTTSNKLLLAPSRGSDVGQWDTPVNADWTAIDGMFGGVTSLSFSSATTVLLTVPATGSVSPSAGPNQSQNALLKFTGTLTGNIVVQFTLPGFYIVQNLCTTGTSFIQLQPAAGTGGGNAIGAPPGRKVHVFYDGTSMDYCNMPETASFLDLAVNATPAWMNACTVAPYLICDGSIYNVSSYPTLGAILGSAFGGNGASTFGVPDLRASYRIPLDNQGANGAANRITAAASGINGTTWGASGGSQSLQAHTHAASDPSGHSHTLAQSELSYFPGSTNIFYVNGAGGGGGLSGTTVITSITNATTGLGTSGNIPPGVVFGITFIKT